MRQSLINKTMLKKITHKVIRFFQNLKLNNFNRNTLGIPGIIILFCIVIFLNKLEPRPYPIKDCREFDLENTVKNFVSKEDCMKDDSCKIAMYFIIDSEQTNLLSKMGNEIKSYSELIEGGEDILEYDNEINKNNYNSVFEFLTNGESVIPNHKVSFSEEDFYLFNKYSIQADPVQFLRKTFDEYLKGGNYGIFEENLTKKCNLVHGELYGLDGTEKSYFKSRFVPFAIYRHFVGGYDIFIIFVDKPDRIFRVWVGYDKNDDYQLKLFKELAVPAEEVKAWRKALRGLLLDSRSSI